MAKMISKASPDAEKFLKGSDDVGFDDGTILIHSPPKYGKTVLAATSAKGCPNDLAEGKPLPKPFVIEDLGWLGFDAGAVAGFNELNLKLPKGQYIDAAAIFLEQGLSAGLATMEKLLDTMMQNSAIRCIVVDTVSRLDKIVSGTFAKVHENSDNTFAMYRDILNYHKRFYDTMQSYSRSNIYLFHSKAAAEGQTTQQKLTKKAMNPAGADTIQPDITGQARTLYIADSNLEIAIMADAVMGSKDKRAVKRYIMPFGGKSMEGGGRFQQALNSEEPAHLGMLRAKIMGGRKK